MLLTVGLLAMLLIGGALAASFYFNFHQVPYNPSKYSWTAPWQVHQLVDFVEATLDLTGSGYESDPHQFSLALKNIAPDSSYVLTNMAYSATWNNGSASETIASGVYNGALIVGNNVTYVGLFTPTLVGIGNVNMTLSSIIWAQTAPITWTTSLVDATGGTVFVVTNFGVTGAAKTYLPGTTTFTISNEHGSAYEYVSFKLEAPELGNLLINQTVDVYLNKAVPVTFNVPFTVTTGGSLTMRLTLFGRHN
jgi:hypothetical protein